MKTRNSESNLNSATLKTPLFFILMVGLCASTITAQPTNNQCKGWDDAYLGIFHISLVIALTLPITISPFLAWIGRRLWLFTAPFRRIVVATVLILFVLLALGPLAPWTIGLGRGWMATVGTDYLQCVNSPFGATGLFGGYIGDGQAAVGQWWIMVLFMILGSALGCAFAAGLQHLLARWVGVRSRIGEGGKA